MIELHDKFWTPGGAAIKYPSSIKLKMKKKPSHLYRLYCLSNLLRHYSAAHPTDPIVETQQKQVEEQITVMEIHEIETDVPTTITSKAMVKYNTWWVYYRALASDEILAEVDKLNHA